MICKAQRIDNGEAVEGYLVEDFGVGFYINASKYLNYKYSYKETYIEADNLFEINPQTLKYSFDGVSWYSEEEIKEALEDKRWKHQPMPYE